MKEEACLKSQPSVRYGPNGYLQSIKKLNLVPANTNQSSRRKKDLHTGPPAPAYKFSALTTRLRRLQLIKNKIQIKILGEGSVRNMPNRNFENIVCKWKRFLLMLIDGKHKTCNLLTDKVSRSKVGATAFNFSWNKCFVLMAFRPLNHSVRKNVISVSGLKQNEARRDNSHNSHWLYHAIRVLLTNPITRKNNCHYGVKIQSTA